MAYMRDQHNATYTSGYSNLNPQGNYSSDAAQTNPPPGSYSWGSTGGNTSSASWSNSYEQTDNSKYGYGYDQSQENYPQDGGADSYGSGYVDDYSSGWQGGDGNYGTQWQGVDDDGNQWQGGGTGDGGQQWQGEEWNNSGTQWQSQGGERSGTQGQGPGRGTSGVHLEGQGNDNSSSHWQDYGQDGSGNQWQSQGRENSGFQWQSQGRDNSGFQYQDHGEDNYESQWQGQGSDNSGNQWGDQKRQNSGFQWQAQGSDNSGNQLQGQGRGKSGFQWQGQGKTSNGAGWQNSGRANTGFNWQGQSTSVGLGRGRGSGVGPTAMGVGASDAANTRTDVASGSAAKGDGHSFGRGMFKDNTGATNRFQGVVGQKGGFGRGGGVVKAPGASSGGSPVKNVVATGGGGGVQSGSGLGNAGVSGTPGGRGAGFSGSQGASGLLSGGGSSGVRGGSGLGSGGVQGRIGLGSGTQGGRGLIKSGVSGVQGGSGLIKSGVGGVQGGSGLVKSGVSGVQGGSGPVKSGVGGIQGGSGPVKSGVSGIQGGSGPVKSGVGGIQGGSGPVKSGVSGVQGGSGPVKSGVSGVQGGSGPVKSGVSGVQGGSGLGKSGVSGAQGGSGPVKSGVSGSQGGIGLVKSGVSGAQGGSGLVKSGVSGAQGGGELVKSGGSGLVKSGVSGAQGGSDLNGGGRGGGSLQDSSGATAKTTPGPAIAPASTQKPEREPTSLEALIERWQAFLKDFVDCGNPVSTLECSLEASKIGLLQLDFNCKFLLKCGNNDVFTAVLHIKNKGSKKDTSVEPVFLARSQGLNKKSAKMSCYEQAYKLLNTSTVEAIMAQKDFSEKVVRQDTQCRYRENPKQFVELFKSSESNHPPQGGKNLPGNKRQFSDEYTGSEAKKARKAEWIENKNLSLAPTKRLEVVMDPDDPLIFKLQMLKQLLRDEGITKVHVMPKIDQLAHKAAIHVQNVYRLEDISEYQVPMYQFVPRMGVYCEIYFDDVYMARGPPDAERQGAVQKAYKALASLLCSQPLDVIANNPRVWHPFMAVEPDVVNIVTKWHGQDNDCLLTTNLANVKQMMHALPDIRIPIETIVLTEHESDSKKENVFKTLEESATRSMMLLECEILRNTDLTFTCTLSLQGKILTSRDHLTKNGAKRLCCEVVLNKLKDTQDIIYVSKEMVGRTVTKNELLLSAAKKKALGEPPAKIFKRTIDYREDEVEDEERDETEEDMEVKSLYPWIAATIYEILDEYYKRVTLEDLMLDLEDMPRSQRDIIFLCAAKMSFRMVNKTKHPFEGTILRRTVTAQDMSKILQLHGGQSGRYQLVSCKNPLSKAELEMFRIQCQEHHMKLVEARTHGDPDAKPGLLPDPEHHPPGRRFLDDVDPSGGLSGQFQDTYMEHGPSRAPQKFYAPRGRAALTMRPTTGPIRSLLGPGMRSQMTPFPFRRNSFTNY